MSNVKSELIKSARWLKQHKLLKVRHLGPDGKEMTTDFVKDSTSLYSYPMMERLPARLELKLKDIIRYIERHGSPYPTAHIGKTWH